MSFIRLSKQKNSGGWHNNALFTSGKGQSEWGESLVDERSSAVVSMPVMFRHIVGRRYGERSFTGTKGGTMRAASLDKLCEFVINAWDQVKIETVVGNRR